MVKRETRHHAPRKPHTDYTAAGWYFVTVSTQHGRHWFGEVADGVMVLSPAGAMIAQWWAAITNKYPTIHVDASVVMPNHLHGLLHFTQTGQQSLPQVMRWFKAMTTNAYIRGVNTADWPRFLGKLWQRSYHDHIIRDAASRDRIRAYIHANPANWHTDNLYGKPTS